MCLYRERAKTIGQTKQGKMGITEMGIGGMESLTQTVFGRQNIEGIRSSILRCTYVPEPGHEKTCLMSCANNKGAVQPSDIV